MATKHIIHETEVAVKELTGRSHKMIIRPDNMSAETMCFGVAEFPANAHAPAHVHENEEEIIYILSGKGEIYFDGAPEPVTPGSCVFIPKKVAHSIHNTSDEIMKLAYVFSPPVKQGSYEKKD